VKIVVVSPHRSDAAFSLGLSVGVWLEKGHAVEVVECFTRSEFAPYVDASLVHANDLMSFVTAVGRRECEEWRKRYGVAKLRITDLNLKDAPMRLHVTGAAAFGLEPDRSEKVWNKVRLALERSRAEAVVLPMGLRGHVDHVTARDAALAVLTEATAVGFYEELPDGFGADLAEAVRGLQMSTRMDLAEVFAGLGVEDVEVAVQRKRRLAMCFDSQIDAATEGKIADACREWSGRERMWGNAAWRAAFL
jgi:LmbE family N-acetylglucosaminyl deacetylase